MEQLTNDEFLAWVEMTYDVDEVSRMLIERGICEYEDVLNNLEEYVLELRDILWDEED